MYIKSQQLVIAVLTAQRFSFQFSNNDNIIVSTGRTLYVAVCVFGCITTKAVQARETKKLKHEMLPSI